MLDLHAHVSDGTPLGDDEYVISADEKSQMQALRRRHPGRPTGPGQVAQVEFEYTRGGTLTYRGAYGPSSWAAWRPRPGSCRSWTWSPP